MTIPAEWLPQAAVPVTAIVEHDDYDTHSCRIKAARDWQARGDDYLLRLLDAAPGSRIVAAFDGHHESRIGHAINS